MAGSSLRTKVASVAWLSVAGLVLMSPAVVFIASRGEAELQAACEALLISKSEWVDFATKAHMASLARSHTGRLEQRLRRAGVFDQIRARDADDWKSFVSSEFSALGASVLTFEEIVPPESEPKTPAVRPMAQTDTQTRGAHENEVLQRRTWRVVFVKPETPEQFHKQVLDLFAGVVRPRVIVTKARLGKNDNGSQLVMEIVTAQQRNPLFAEVLPPEEPSSGMPEDELGLAGRLWYPVREIFLTENCSETLRREIAGLVAKKEIMSASLGALERNQVVQKLADHTMHFSAESAQSFERLYKTLNITKPAGPEESGLLLWVPAHTQTSR